MFLRYLLVTNVESVRLISKTAPERDKKITPKSGGSVHIANHIEAR